MAKGYKTGGRGLNVPNKTTHDARKAIAAFVDENAHRLVGWLDQVANGVPDPNDDSKMIVRADPAKAFDMFQSVVEYHIPKLARSEVKMTGEVTVRAAQMSDDQILELMQRDRNA